jgi:hypothetical protein
VTASGEFSCISVMGIAGEDGPVGRAFDSDAEQFADCGGQLTGEVHQSGVATDPSGDAVAPKSHPELIGRQVTAPFTCTASMKITG